MHKGLSTFIVVLEAKHSHSAGRVLDWGLKGCLV